METSRNIKKQLEVVALYQRVKSEYAIESILWTWGRLVSTQDLKNSGLINWWGTILVSDGGTPYLMNQGLLIRGWQYSEMLVLVSLFLCDSKVRPSCSFGGGKQCGEWGTPARARSCAEPYRVALNPLVHHPFSQHQMVCLMAVCRSVWPVCGQCDGNPGPGWLFRLLSDSFGFFSLQLVKIQFSRTLQ